MENVDMAIIKTPTFPHSVTAAEIIIGISASGTIKKTRTYQMTTVPNGPLGQPRKRIQIQYPYIVRVQPDSQAQLDCRQNFTDGMTAWSALTSGQKEVWNELARENYRQRGRRPGSYRMQCGCNLFMREYLNNP